MVSCQGKAKKGHIHPGGIYLSKIVSRSVVKNSSIIFAGHHPTPRTDQQTVVQLWRAASLVCGR